MPDEARVLGGGQTFASGVRGKAGRGEEGAGTGACETWRWTEPAGKRPPRQKGGEGKGPHMLGGRMKTVRPLRL